MKSLLLLASVLVSATPALAEPTCEVGPGRYDGPNIYGQHTIRQLSEETMAGDCSAAAYLSRRARDAQGFAETHCPDDTTLRETATAMLKLGQDTLQLPKCQD